MHTIALTNFHHFYF